MCLRYDRMAEAGRDLMGKKFSSHLSIEVGL